MRVIENFIKWFFEQEQERELEKLYQTLNGFEELIVDRQEIETFDDLSEIFLFVILLYIFVVFGVEIQDLFWEGRGLGWVFHWLQF